MSPVTLQESYVAQQFQLGVETTYGTEVPTTKAIKSVKAPFTPNYETEPFMASGDLAASVNVVNDAYTTVDVTGKADYNAMPYFTSSVWGQVTPTPVGTGAYEWLHNWDGRITNNPASYSALYGSTTRARKCTGLIFTEYGMDVSRGGIDFTATGFAKKMTSGASGITAYPRNEKVDAKITSTTPPTAGTFTLTYGAQTTGTIVYNATAAQVQTALEALSSIGTGNVLVTGGPGPNGTFRIEFRGTLANTNTTAITATLTGLTGGSGHTFSATVVQEGGTVTDVPPVPMFPLQFNAYLDTTWAALGGSQLLYCYNFSIDVPERYSRTRPINAAQSSDGVVENEDQTFTVTMTLGADATADQQLVNLDAGSMIFVRLEAIGATISTGFPYLFRQDMALFVTGADAFQSSDGVHVIPITGTLGRDTTSGLATRVLVRNTLAAL